MNRRASDSSLVKIYRQAGALIQMVDQGKRDPDWVSGVLQGAIEHREDGRTDFVRDTKVVLLGEFEVDYETPIAELADGLKSINPYFELFESQPKPMYYTGGLWKAELCLVNYTFHQGHDAPYGGAPLFDDVRSLLTRDGYVSVQFRELLAVLRNIEPDRLKEILSIIALGCGVTSSGRSGDTPCAFELVPTAKRFLVKDDFELRAEHVTRGYARNEDHFLVRKVEPARRDCDF